jgi:hypothetical protein
MNQSDIQFRKNCQFYHTKISKLLKKGEIQQAKELINKVSVALLQWENNLKSARFKVNLLKNIYTDLTRIEKRASYKLDRRQQEENDPE